MSSLIALVTGGGVRLGAAVCESLAGAGWDILVHYHRSGPQAEELAQRLCEKHGVRVETIEADLKQESSARELAGEIERKWGRLDGLVNNAGMLASTPVDEAGRGKWDDIMALNLRAPWLLSMAMRKLLLKSASGAVVNITDIIRTWPDHDAYVVSKSALEALTRQLAVEFAPEIRVNAVAPGTIMFPESYSAQKRQRIIDRIPMRRTGSGRDIGETVRFLLEGPDFITGQVIAVDGGRGLNNIF